jgi:hypothetical protein
MNLRLRKVRGSPVAPEARENQDKLHNITLQRLAVRIDDCLDPKYIIRSDQFGMHLFPQAVCQCVEKGDSEVKGVLKEDNRLYTGDPSSMIMHNMMVDAITARLAVVHLTPQTQTHPKLWRCTLRGGASDLFTMTA